MNFHFSVTALVYTFKIFAIVSLFLINTAFSATDETLPDDCLYNAYSLSCFWPKKTSLRDFHDGQLEAIAIEVKMSFSTAEPLNEILLRGHSSTWPNTPVEQNAMDRAVEARSALKAHLISQGIDIDQVNVIALGRSDLEPLYSNNTGEGRAFNRRVEIILSHAPPPKDDEEDSIKSDDPPEKGVLIFSKNTLSEPITGLKVPADMPPVRFPRGFKDCSQSQIDEIRYAWALAHYFMWRSDQLMDWLATQPSKDRAKAWVEGLPAKSSKLSNPSPSPRNWFGPYHKKRFKNVDAAIEKVFSNRFQGRTFKAVCEPQPAKNPGRMANHGVFGRVIFFANFFLEPNAYRALTIIHELYHPLVLRSGAWVMDTHCTGGGCDKFYDTDAHKLAWSNKPRDYRLAIRNNDNHAWFAASLGKAIRKGVVTQFPPK